MWNVVTQPGACDITMCGFSLGFPTGTEDELSVFIPNLYLTTVTTKHNDPESADREDVVIGFYCACPPS